MSKKLLIIILLFLISLSAILVYYFYPELQIYYFKLFGKEKELCSTTKMYFNDLSNTVGKMAILEFDLNDSLSEVCDFTVIGEIPDYGSDYGIEYNILSCDYDKIKKGIENPNLLNVNDIRTYSYLSIPNSLKFEIEYFNNELTKNCDFEMAFSCTIFNIIFTGSHSTLYLSQIGLTKTCLDNNFTENEKKECLVTLLNAEKSTINDLSKEISDINLTACRQNTYDLFKTQSEISKYQFTPKIITSICQKMNEFRKDIKDKTISSNLNDLEKHLILSNLLIQNSYFGQRDINKRYYQILLDNMVNLKYRSIFEDSLKDLI